MKIKNLVIAFTAMTALSAQAATVSLNGTITGCVGLCTVFSSVGNSIDDQNQTPNALVWTGTAAEYAALGAKDANTLYFVI